jgi:hypothetical protein
MTGIELTVDGAPAIPIGKNHATELFSRPEYMSPAGRLFHSLGSACLFEKLEQSGANGVKQASTNHATCVTIRLSSAMAIANGRIE